MEKIQKNREVDFISFTEILGQDYSKVSGLLFFFFLKKVHIFQTNPY